MPFLSISVDTIVQAVPPLLVLLWLIWHRSLRSGQETRRLAQEIEDLNRRNDWLNLCVEHAGDGIVLQRMDARIIFANKAYCDLVGRPIQEIFGRNPLEFCLPPENTPPPDVIENFVYDRGDPHWQGLHIMRNRRKDGTLFWNQISVSFHEESSGTRYAILICREITAQIEAQQALEAARNDLHIAASCDPLTKLANRATLKDYLLRHFRARGSETDHLVLAAGHAPVLVQPASTIGLISVDVDKFKGINDTHGHAAGDCVICHVADTMSALIRKDGLVARLGGDEFVSVIPNLGSLDELLTIAERLHEGLSTVVDWRGRPIPCSVSLGAAFADDTVEEPDQLLQMADWALYEAKKQGRGRVVLYDAALQARHERSTRLGRHLKKEIADGRLTFEFQPILCTATGRIGGFETLVRWNHPSEGLLSPAGFLDLAERNGLMAELDLCAMDAALSLGAELRDAGYPGLRIGFNASPDLLNHPDFMKKLTEATATYRLAAEQVAIEIIETVVLGEDARDSPAMQAISHLRDAGYHVLLDDFGTGFAGLSHLARLPLSGIKIDRSMTERVISDETSQKIVAAVADLCGNLGLTLVAEGVETQEIADWLIAAGCPSLQGYWLSRAISRGHVLEFLDAHDRAGFGCGRTGPRRPGPANHRSLAAPIA
jgi:diguanylate cyclase (GGDEF)-like protein/PAS domain S-box-containing protein